MSPQDTDFSKSASFPLQPVSSIRGYLDVDPADLSAPAAKAAVAVADNVADALGVFAEGTTGTATVTFSGTPTSFDVSASIDVEEEVEPVGETADPVVEAGRVDLPGDGYVSLAAGATLEDAAGTVIAEGPGTFKVEGVLGSEDAAVEEVDPADVPGDAFEAPAESTVVIPDAPETPAEPPSPANPDEVAAVTTDEPATAAPGDQSVTDATDAAPADGQE